MSKNNIPLCPLMSIGRQVDAVCTQERCAWYLKAYKTCSMYIVAHNAALEIAEKQKENK